MDLRRFNRIFFIGLSILLVITMFVVSPYRMGDGDEYALMQISLQERFPPILNESDISKYAPNKTSPFGTPVNPHASTWYNKSGEKSFGYLHFWMYSLTTLPVHGLLHLGNINMAKSMQITNALLLVFSIMVVILSNLSEKRKFLFALLLMVSPIMWFVYWTGPEVFIVAGVTCALIFLHSKKYKLAIAATAVASMQSQPLILFVFYIFICAALNTEKKETIKTALLGLIAFLPSIYSYAYFGELSLFREHYLFSLKAISFKKILEIFIDPNLGLAFYYLIPFMIFVIIIINNFKKKRLYELPLLIIIISTASLYTTGIHWNGGTIGPMRYSLTFIPFIIYVVVDNIKIISSSKLLKMAVVFGVIVQIGLIAVIAEQFSMMGKISSPEIPPIANFLSNNLGEFYSPIDRDHHTPWVKVILKYLPEFYNPTPIIFYGRNRGGNPEKYYYLIDGKCRKVIGTCDTLPTIEKKCGSVPGHIVRSCREDINYGNKYVLDDPNWFYTYWFYINY